MKTIGITGGVGVGKSRILSYIEQHYNCRVITADRVAHQLEEPGQSCYQALVDLLGGGILLPDRTIERGRMAELIFSAPALLTQVNEIVHPAVKTYILDIIELEKRENRLDFLFVEAALLIEEGYGEILDELWYIHADEVSRRKRLSQSRGYTEEKMERIIAGQLKEEDFRLNCDEVIDNSGDIADTYSQIDKKLGEYLWRK